MESGPPPPVEEDYKFFAKIEIGERTESVPCKIFLPKTIMESPQVYLFPNNRRARFLMGKGKMNITGQLGNKPGNITEFILEDTHISGGSTRTWGDSGLEESYIKLYPANVIIKHDWPNDNNREDSTLYFHLTPSELLAPNDWRSLSYTGEATVDYGEKLSFQLSEDFRVTFGNHYKWIKHNKASHLSVKELYCDSTIRGIITENEISTYLSMLDRFLMLVSYAEDQICVTLRVEILNRDQRITIYRMNRITPELDAQHSTHHFNIDKKRIEEFLNTSWNTWCNSKYEHLLQRAIATNAMTKNRTVDAEFLALFSAIETLLLIYRIENDLEYVICEESDWKKVRKALKTAIKNSPIVRDDKSKRELLYQGIDGLNRVSLQYTLTHMVDSTTLSFRDLWPFMSQEHQYSLTYIRNRLVHGDSYPNSIFQSLILAQRHLKAYYDRLLIFSLGWDYNKANIGPDKLHLKGFHDDWKKEIVDIGNWDNS